MPIILTHPEPHLFYNLWQGTVLLNDIFKAAAETTQHAQSLGEAFYVLIIDATDLKNMPLEIRGLLHTSELTRGAVAFLILNPPAIGALAARLVGKFSRLPVEVYTDREQALRRARALIAAHPAPPDTTSSTPGR
jgi:hypothetical protein